MKTTQRVFLNSATRWFAIAVQGALGLFLVRFLLSELGQDGYGLVSLMGGVIAFSSIAEFGLSGALSRYLAAQVVSKNNNKFNELASTAMLFYIIIGTTLAISCSLLAKKSLRFLMCPRRFCHKQVSLSDGTQAQLFAFPSLPPYIQLS